MRSERPAPGGSRRWPLVVAGCLLAAGCRQDMHDAPRYEPLEASTFFADGTSARPIPEGTVARGQLREDTAFYQGKDGSGQLLTALPVPLTRELLERGHERFEIFCSVCHDSVGTGRGMIVRRGFRQPPSFHEARLREAPIGHFFDVMTQGFGVMSSYAKQVPAADRWAIAAYIRALQLSQGVALASLPPALQQEARSALAAGPADEEGGGH